MGRMQWTNIAIMVGIALMAFSIFTASRETLVFQLPEDAAKLAALNAEDFRRTVLSAVGAVMSIVAFALKLYGKAKRDKETT